MECDAAVDTRAHLAVLGVLSIHHSPSARFPRSDRAVRSDLKRPRVAKLAHAAAWAARPSCAPPAVRATRSRVSNQRRRTCRRSGKRGSEDSVGRIMNYSRWRDVPTQPKVVRARPQRLHNPVA